MEVKLLKKHKKIKQLIKRKPGTFFNLYSGNIFCSPLPPQQFFDLAFLYSLSCIQKMEFFKIFKFNFSN